MKRFFSLLSLLLVATYPSEILASGEAMGSDSLSVDWSENVLRNGTLTAWEERRPSAWKTGQGDYEPDPAMALHKGVSLRLRNRKSDRGASQPTSIAQIVDLEPHTDYRLSFRMAKDGGGTVFVRVLPIGPSGAVEANATTPLKWDNGWSGGFPWHHFQLKFQTEDTRKYQVSILQTGQPGEDSWIQDIELQALSAAPPPADAYRLFTHSIMVPFERHALPAKSAPLRELAFNAAPGQYEAALAGLRANRDLQKAHLSVAGDLADGKGNAIPAAQVTIRQIAEQALLPLAEPTSVPAGENLGWWITVHVPDNIPAGDYQGALRLTTDGREMQRIPIAVTVGNFRLPAVNIPMFVYHNERYFPEGLLRPDLRQAYYKDMREHGMNTVTVYNNPDTGEEKADFDHDYFWKMDAGAMDRFNAKGPRLTEDEIRQRFSFGLNQVLPLIKQSGLCSHGEPIPWLAAKAGKYGWGGFPEEVLKSAFQTWRGHRDWPQPLFYVSDEPDGHPDRIEEARKQLALVKQADASIQTVTANVAVPELGKDYNVWIQLDRRMTYEMADLAEADHAQLWVYNCNIPTENAAFTRAMFGLWAYRAKVKGVALWAYYDAINWQIDSQGQITGTNGTFGFSRICPSPAGPVPTVSWETTREGIDDYRYAMLFDELLEKLRARTADESKAAEALAPVRKVQLDRAVADGDAENAATNDIERHYLASLRLARLTSVMETVRKKIIDTIPYDALAMSLALPNIWESKRFYPVLGLGDPRLSGETKRALLRSYIGRMNAALSPQVSQSNPAR